MIWGRNIINIINKDLFQAYDCLNLYLVQTSLQTDFCAELKNNVERKSALWLSSHLLAQQQHVVSLKTCKVPEWLNMLLCQFTNEVEL